ncbi:MAG: ABC transporter permease [Candidatus Bathyarchaeota archaeon]|nr:ABC transporter permease [Candidatus Bathyarchaeota archaeon]
MKTRDVFSYSFSAIKLRKLRAALTTLGVIIGIAAIVALLGITQGVETTITSEISQGLATDTLIVSTSTGGLGGGGGNQGGEGGIGSGGVASSNFKLFLNYTDNLNSTLDPGIVSSFAIIQQSGYMQVGDEVRPIGTIIGVDFEAFDDVYGSTFKAGSGEISLTPSDTDIVVGARIQDPRLNGTTLVNAGDQADIIWTNATQLTFTNETYTGQISAVLETIGGFSFVGPSDTGVYIPLSQAQSFFGTDEASFIIVQLTDSDNATITQATKAITEYFKNQVTVISPNAVVDLLSNVVNVLGLFVAGIAGISLLVAGIGIMNIMIVSLIERTREIGILKALGMKSRTVLSIFLAESALIGLIGGVLGVIAGWGLARVVGVIVERMFELGSGLTLTPVFTPQVILGALAFGIGVSIIFALYPAWRASKLKPVDALRYE